MAIRRLSRAARLKATTRSEAESLGTSAAQRISAPSSWFASSDVEGRQRALDWADAPD